MRIVFTLPCLVLCTISICYAAEAAQSPLASAADEWYKSILNLGAAGSFILYLIYTQHVERKRKDKENERWQRMETVLLELVGSTTKCIIEITASNKELRGAVDSLVAEMSRLVTIISAGSDHRRRVSDG